MKAFDICAPVDSKTSNLFVFHLTGDVFLFDKLYTNKLIYLKKQFRDSVFSFTNLTLYIFYFTDQGLTGLKLGHSYSVER